MYITYIYIYTYIYIHIHMIYIPNIYYIYIYGYVYIHNIYTDLFILSFSCIKYFLDDVTGAIFFLFYVLIYANLFLFQF